MKAIPKTKQFKNRVIQGQNWACAISQVGVSLYQDLQGEDIWPPFFFKTFVNKKDQAKLSVHFSSCDLGRISIQAGITGFIQKILN